MDYIQFGQTELIHSNENVSFFENKTLKKIYSSIPIKVLSLCLPKVKESA